MASEIRVNKIENRSGLGTVTFADTGVDLAGIVTATTFSGSGASLTNLPAANVTGTLPAISGANLTNLPAANLTGALPAISGANLTGIAATDNVRTGILDVAGVSTFRNTMNVGAAVTISESGIEASGIGITCANINGGQIGGRRNIIINGAMQVAQRSTSTVAVSDGTNENYQTIDRMKFSFGNSAAGAANISQSTDAPTTLGFTKSHKTDVTTVNTTASGQQIINLAYRIEGQDLRSSGWNHLSSSSFLTLSFYFKTTKTGNSKLPIMFRTRHGTNYYYVKNVTITDPTNWNRYTVTIPGNSNLQIDDANTAGMDIYFTYYSGPDKDTGSEASWGSTNAYSTSDSTNYFDSTSNDMFITGVQLEVGSQATAFEHRSFGEELQLCQRYYELIVERDEGSNAKENCIGLFWGDGTNSFTWVKFHQKKRTQPTLEISDFTNAFRFYGSGGGVNANTMTANTLHRDGMLLEQTGNAGIAGFTRVFVDGSDGLKALVAASSEL